LYSLIFVPANEQSIALKIQPIDNSKDGGALYGSDSPFPVNPLSLTPSESRLLINSFTDLLLGVADSKVCFAETDTGTEFFINPQAAKLKPNPVIGLSLPPAEQEQFCFVGLNGNSD